MVNAKSDMNVVAYLSLLLCGVGATGENPVDLVKSGYLPDY